MTKSPFPPGSRIVCYLRDSGGAGQEESTIQQLAVIREWVEGEGLVLTHVFKDEAKPGSSVTGREGFQDMMHYLRDGAKEAGIVIWNFNRFSRDIDDSQYFRADLRRRGYIIHSLNDSVPDSPIGRVFETLLDWKNEQYLADLSRDIKRGQHHMITTYGGVPGRPPKGFMREPVRIGERRDGSEHIVHRWVPDPEIIHLVIKAFEMRARGSTYKQIHDATNLYDRKGGYLHMFTNRIFIGELHFGETVVLDYCEPVIDQETWDAVQAIHKQRSAFHASLHPRRISSSFILSGLVFCSQCGTHMNGDVITGHGKRYLYYKCKSYRDRWSCRSRAIPKEALENTVIEELKNEILTPENLAAIQEKELKLWHKDHDKRAKERARLDRQYLTLTRKMGNLAKAVADTGGSRTLLEKLQQLERREAEILFQMSRFEPQPDPILDADIEVLGNLLITSLEAKGEGINQLLRRLIHRIEVKRKKQTIRGVMYFYSPINAYSLTHRSEQPYTHKLRVKILSRK